MDVAEPTRLVVQTVAGPVEVAAAAVVAAAVARDVFSSDIREDASGPGFITFLVTSPLSHSPSLRLRVGWVGHEGDESGVALEERAVTVDIEAVGDDEPCSESRSARTWQAVERFNHFLETQLRR